VSVNDLDPRGTPVGDRVEDAGPDRPDRVRGDGAATRRYLALPHEIAIAATAISAAATAARFVILCLGEDIRNLTFVTGRLL
jgi:hypothetical protein